MTTTTMTKAICLPEDLVEAVIFKLREYEEFNIPDQSSLQVQLEEILKTQSLPIAELVVTDVPATVDHSSHDANAATVTHQDETANTSQPQAEEENDDGTDSSSDEDDRPFSPHASQSSTPRTSPRNSPTSSPDGSPEGSPEGSPKGKSSELPKQADDDVIKPNPSDGGISDSEPAASSKAASDETTPPLNIMIDAPSPEYYPVAASQEMVLPNETPDSPTTEKSLESHPADSSPASVHTESILSDSLDSISTEGSLKSNASDLTPASRPASRPQSRASSPQAFGDLSFEEKWNIFWDTEGGGLSFGSQLVAAYASPVRNGTRTRTSCDSHQDPGRWCIDPDGFINEVYRAGGPRLTPLPFIDSRLAIIHRCCPITPLLLTWDCMTFLTEIMTKYKIQPTCMELRISDWYQDPRYHGRTCLTFEATRDVVDDSWPEACREIWEYIKENVESKHWRDISVEIHDPMFDQYPYKWGSANLPDLHLDDLSSELLGAIDTSEIIKTRWNYLIKSRHEEKVLAFTLFVNYRSDRDWRIPREQMVAVLDRKNFPQIAIFITKHKDWGELMEVLF